MTTRWRLVGRFLIVLGLVLLYASVYLFKLAPDPAIGFYFRTVAWQEIAVSVVPPMALLVVGGMLSVGPLNRLQGSWIGRGGAALALVALLLIAAKACALAGGVRVARIATLAIGSLALVGGTVLFRANEETRMKLFRLLASLGYALFVLAVYRTGLPDGGQLGFAARAAATGQPAQSLPRFPGPPELGQGQERRRAIWIIFDELDQDRLRSSLVSGRPSLPNFERLAAIAVDARAAHAPSSRTLLSIPGLLLATPVGGFQVTGRAGLDLLTPEGSHVRFSEDQSVFGQLPGGPASGAIVGFYHPYCEIFHQAGCQEIDVNPGHSVRDLFLGPIGYPFASVVDDGNWGRGTAQFVERLPALLRDSRSLTFIHINAPHLPSSYAQKSLRMRPPLDDKEEYDQGLAEADEILGRVLALLEKGGRREPAVLVVSSDHWWRGVSPTIERPIPLLIWIVGNKDGRVIDQPISTVHTGKLILDFLWGRVSTQDEIAHWWDGRRVYPAWMEL